MYNETPPTYRPLRVRFRIRRDAHEHEAYRLADPFFVAHGELLVRLLAFEYRCVARPLVLIPVDERLLVRLPQVAKEIARQEAKALM